jgi:hypothetical protein
LAASYGKLYRKSFDADPVTLHNIETYPWCISVQPFSTWRFARIINWIFLPLHLWHISITSSAQTSAELSLVCLRDRFVNEPFRFSQVCLEWIISYFAYFTVVPQYSI